MGLDNKDPRFDGPDPFYGYVKGMNRYGADKTPYAPNRDVLVLWQYVLEQVWILLEEDRYPDTLREYMKEHNINVLDVMNAYNLYVDTHNYFVGEESKVENTIDGAAKRSGYSDLPIEFKMAIEMLIGRVSLSVYWYAVRDLTELGTIPTQYHVGYDRWALLMNEVQNAMDGKETAYSKKLKKKYKQYDLELDSKEGEDDGI